MIIYRPTEIQAFKSDIDDSEATAFAKKFSYVDEDIDTELITSLIASAIVATEHYIGRTIVEKKYTATYCVDQDATDFVFHVPKAPIKSISTVMFVEDVENVAIQQQSDYLFRHSGGDGYIELNNGGAWNNQRVQRINNAIVTYTAGFGEKLSDAPQDIQLAIWQYVDQIYNDRAAAMPEASKKLLYRFREIIL